MCVFSTLFIFLASKDYVLLYVNFFLRRGDFVSLSLFFFKVICSQLAIVLRREMSGFLLVIFLVQA